MPDFADLKARQEEQWRAEWAESQQAEEQNRRWEELQREKTAKAAKEATERKAMEEQARKDAVERELRLQREQAERERLYSEKLRRDKERQDKVDKERKEALQRSTEPEALRKLRDRIRERYALDTEIWSLKDVKGPDRPYVVIKMKKADAILNEIHTIVGSWTDDAFKNPEERKAAQNIRDKVMAPGKRWWMDNPPFECD